MYQRFKQSLFAPTQLFQYIKDSWTCVWVYFFLLLVLASLPFLMVRFATNGLTDLEKMLIKESFNENISGNYKIEDGNLIIDQSMMSQEVYLKIDSYTIGIINTPDSPEYNMIRIIFVKDGIRFSVAGVDSTLYSYESMNLLNYDFSDYSSSNIDKFIGAIDKVLIINKEVNQTVQSLVIITSTMIELLFFILLTVIFSRHPLPFKLKFKVAVYVSTIYVLLSLFALFTNNGIFIFAGIILLMVYMRKALSKITLL